MNISYIKIYGLKSVLLICSKIMIWFTDEKKLWTQSVINDKLVSFLMGLPLHVGMVGPQVIHVYLNSYEIHLVDFCSIDYCRLWTDKLQGNTESATSANSMCEYLWIKLTGIAEFPPNSIIQ